MTRGVRVGWLACLFYGFVARAQTTQVLIPGHPPLIQVTEPKTAAPVNVYEQRVYPPMVAPLVAPERALAVVATFQQAYLKLGNPRLLIAVNRELLEPNVGESNRVTQVSSRDAASGDVNLTPQRLADFQTRREVERLFGRPLRLASAQLVDFQAAEAALAAIPMATADERRTRLEPLVDVAIEVLITAKQPTISRNPGGAAVTVPDVQVTAIRLKDSQILGQASSADLLGRGNRPAELTRQYGVPAIVEATALALMEDMAKVVH